MDSNHYQVLMNELNIVYEQYPRISIRLETRWGTKKCHDYLKCLLIKDRSNRRGFSKEIYTSLLRMYILHDYQFGHFDSPLELTNLNVDGII